MRGTGTETDPWILRTWEDFEAVIGREGEYAQFAPNTVIDLDEVNPIGGTDKIVVKCSVDGNGVQIWNFKPKLIYTQNELITINVQTIRNNPDIYFKNFNFYDVSFPELNWHSLIGIRYDGDENGEAFTLEHPIFSNIYVKAAGSFWNGVFVHTGKSSVGQYFESKMTADQLFFGCTFDIFINTVNGSIMFHTNTNNQNKPLLTFDHCIFHFLDNSCSLSQWNCNNYNQGNRSNVFRNCLFTGNFTSQKTLYSSTIVNTILDILMLPDSNNFINNVVLNSSKFGYSASGIISAAPAQITDTDWLNARGFQIGVDAE